MVSSTPRLSEYARKFVFPSTISRTVWPRVEAKGRELGLGFDWWQAQLGTVCLGYGEDGKYVATVGGVGMSIPRQVGKTYFVLALLVIMCILFPGLQVVWTAHHLRTSTKTFTALRGICGRKKIAPHVKAMRAANGEQQVAFNNGSMIMFGARSMGFGRGFDEIDIEVYDEAQILDTKALEDMVAATNQARHIHGALLFFMGTPPRPTDPSGAFTERRTEAWAGGVEDAIWLEIGADPNSDVSDRAQWPLMNPSYPLRTPEESLLRLRKNLKDPDSWNREGRGVWDEDGKAKLLPTGEWDDLLDAESVIDGPVWLGLEVAQDASWCCIAAAGRRSDGLWHVQVVETRQGTHGVAEAIAVLPAASNGVAVTPTSPAGSVVKELDAAGVKVHPVSSVEYAQGCVSFYRKFKQQQLRHLGHAEMNVAVANARKRTSGDSWVFDKRNPEIDITPLASVVAALRMAETGKPRNAGRGRAIALT